MGILDSFRKSKEKKGEHTTPPPQGHTLAQILQDKNKSHLFGKLLMQGEKEDLAQRLAEGKLNENDIALLEIERLAFSEKLAQAEKVEKLLTKENIIDFARNHPEFEKIVNLVGPEKAVKAIQSQLKDISITDEGRFFGILGAVGTLENYKNGEYKEINDKVEKLLKDNKITSQEYLTVLAIDNPLEKEKALKKLVTKSYGTYDKICNFLSGGEFSRYTFEDLQNSETSLEESIAQLNAHQKDIGEVLFYSISGHDNMRNALFSELVNEKTPEEPKSGFKEAKKEAFNEDEFEKEWKKEKEYVGYDGLSDAEKERAKQTFVDNAQMHYLEKNTGKGFWHEILVTITEALINSKKDKLK